jgi:hypothetical protein
MRIGENFSVRSIFFVLLKVLLLVLLAAASFCSFGWIGWLYGQNKVLGIGDKGVRQAIQFFKESRVDKAMATLYLSESLSQHRKPKNGSRLEKETACLLGKGFAIKLKYCLAESYLKYAETLPYKGELSPLCSKTYEGLDRYSDSCAWQRNRVYSALQNIPSQPSQNDSNRSSDKRSVIREP